MQVEPACGLASIGPLGSLRDTRARQRTLLELALHAPCAGGQLFGVGTILPVVNGDVTMRVANIVVTNGACDVTVRATAAKLTL